MAAALAVAVSMVAALAAAASMAAWLAASAVAASADSVAAGWPANSVAVNFAAAANFVVVDSVIATSGAAASEIATSGAAASDSASVTTMTTTPPVTRMDLGTRMDLAVAITRTPTAMRTKTTAVGTWFGDACTPRMAGTCNSVRCLPTSALSRAEVTGDFGGSLMRQARPQRVCVPKTPKYDHSGDEVRPRWRVN